MFFQISWEYIKIGVWLLTCPTTPTFHLSSVHFLRALCTYLALPHPMVAHLSWCECDHIIDDLSTHLLRCPSGNERITTHDKFKDPVAIIVLESGTHVQREVSHLFFHHPMTNGYFYHQRWLSNLDGRHHCWFDSHRYGAKNIDNDNTCSNDDYLREDTIICWMSTMWWLHSPCYWNVWVSSFLFWFIFNCLCINHFHMSLVIFFSPFNACFLLLIVHVCSLVACISHKDSSITYYTCLGFLISSTHQS